MNVNTDFTPSVIHPELSRILYGGISGVGIDELPLVHQAARNLGDYAVEVITDKSIARSLIDKALVEQYDGRWDKDRVTDEQISDLATAQATRLASTMYDAGKVALVWLTHTGGERAFPHEIYEEIKFRVTQGMSEEPVTVDEVLYGALNPVNPQILFD